MATLTCAALTSIYYTAESMFKDGQKKADYVAEVNAALAVIENTTAQIKLIDNANKPRTARVYWNKKTTTTTDDCSAVDYCELDGDESDAGCKDYTVSLCAGAGFILDEAKYQGSNLNVNEVFADNMLVMLKELDQKVTQGVIARLDSFSSPNLFEGGLFCNQAYLGATWNITNVDPSLWTPEIMIEFLRIARINKFDNPFLLDGDNLYTPWHRAQMNAGNADGSGAKTMFSKMKYYEDMVNMAIVNPSARKTFMVNKGTVAFNSYALWAGKTMSTPLEHGAGKWKFSIPSKNLPGVVYDVYTETVCSGKFEKHIVRAELTYDVFNGPAALDGSTGVLEFHCAPCPTS